MHDDELSLGDLGVENPERPLPRRERARIDFSDAAVSARRVEANARKATKARVPQRARAASAAVTPEGMPSEDAVALAFVDRHTEHIYVAPWHRWYTWDGMRWREDSTGKIYELIRNLVRALVAGGKAERSTANASFVAGVEKLLRTDQRIVVLPEQLDADPWALNTQSGIVDLRTGELTEHSKDALCTRVANAPCDVTKGAELWQEFLAGITQDDIELQFYLQRVAGYCATGVVSEDVLPYLFGIGANGKSSFAEAIAHVLGDYAKIFAAEVLMEAKGERHPTELAQFMGVRFALTSEPASNAAWNDSRIKSLTGDAVISARFMRGDNFTFARTHKTMVLGNHMPRLADVTHAIRRRVQMVPFRAVFEATTPPGMRERLKAEAGGAILAWIVQGAAMWATAGTAPPQTVRDCTTDYLSDQDVVGEWLAERCTRDTKSFELSGALHRNYSAWCEGQGHHPKSNAKLSEYLVSCGFKKEHTAIGKVFRGLKLGAQ